MNKRTLITLLAVTTPTLSNLEDGGFTKALGGECPAGEEYVAVEDCKPAVVTDGGEWIVSFENGDVDGSGAINLSDAVFLLNHLFLSGPAPLTVVCATCRPHPQAEICDNGTDDDDDGIVDCNDPDCSAVCREEDCSNGVDDDLDGLVDCADPDCDAESQCVSSIRFFNNLACAGAKFHATLTAECANESTSSLTGIWSNCITVPATDNCRLCVVADAGDCGDINSCGRLDLKPGHVYFVVLTIDDGSLALLVAEVPGDCAVPPPPFGKSRKMNSGLSKMMAIPMEENPAEKDAPLTGLVIHGV